MVGGSRTRQVMICRSFALIVAVPILIRCLIEWTASSTVRSTMLSIILRRITASKSNDRQDAPPQPRVLQPGPDDSRGFSYVAPSPLPLSANQAFRAAICS